MRILEVSSLYGAKGGGSGVIAKHIAEGLLAAGHKVLVVTIGGTRRVSVSEEQGVRIYRFMPLNIYPFREKDTHPLWQRTLWQLGDIYNFHAARVLRQILLREAPDIIHINKMRGFSSAVWQVAAQSLPGRVVQTCHDYESMSPEGLMRGSIGKMALNRKWPVRGYQLLRASLSSGISVVTAPSEFTLNRIVSSGLFGSAVAKVIPNTHGWTRTQLARIQSGGVHLAGSRIQFLYIGRLESEKGIVELCRAFSELSASYPSIRLDIAGEGTLAAELRRQYGPHPAIRFLGMIDGKTKQDALAEAAGVVVPSLVEEVFGLAAVEALAFGKPVIACRIGGLPEVVRDGETGWLIEPGSIEALKRGMENLLQRTPAELSQMSRICGESAMTFAREKIIDRYESTFHELCRPAVPAAI